MKTIAILALEDATMASIDNAYQMLTRVNDFIRYQARSPFYNVSIVTLETTVTLNNGLYQITAEQIAGPGKTFDVIVIPQLCGDFSRTWEINAKYKNWLLMQYGSGPEIVSLCSGSFMLAYTGLLDGKKCAVHWAARNEFATRFPLIKVVDDIIVRDEASVYTCGGGYSYLNLILYIIEKHLGREMSVLTAKMFQVDLSRKDQFAFVIFQGQKNHNERTVLQAQEFIENNATEIITVNELCKKVGVARRTFERKFKRFTGNSIQEYVQRVKIEYAKKQLETGTKSIAEIVYETGYNDVDAFRRLFRKHTNSTPGAYRSRYSQTLAASLQ